MEEQHPDSMDPDLPSLAQRIDAMCRRFEREWAEEHPEIDTFLGELEDCERPLFFGALLARELELRLRSGGRPTLVDFQARYPHKADLLETLFSKIDGSWNESRLRGQASHGQFQEVRRRPAEVPPRPARLIRAPSCRR